MPVALSVGFGSLLTLLAVSGMSAYDEQAQRTELARATDRRVSLLQGALDGLVHDLFATVSFFMASQVVESEEFATFTEPLLQRHPVWTALAWLPRVSESERPEWEHRMREAGLSEFSFVGLDGKPLPPGSGTAGEYYPAVFIAPKRLNEGTVGLDLASEPRRAAMLRRARDEGHAVATEPLSLMSDTEARDGILVFVPYYRGRPQTEAERRSTLRGFVVGVFRVSTLLAYVLRNEGGVTVVLEDPLAPADEPLARFGPQGSGSWLSAPGVDLDIGQRKWTVRCLAPPGWFENPVAMLRPIVLVAGILLTLLMAGYVRVLVRRSETKSALRTSEERTRAIIDNAFDAIITTDALGAITGWNARAATLFAWAEKDVVGREIATVILPEDQRRELQRHLDGSDSGGETPRKILLELTAMRRGGEVFPIELAIVDLPQRRGGRFCLFVRDVSWRKRAETELRESENRYRTLVEHAPEAMVVLDAETGRFVDANHNAEALFGLDRVALRQRGPVEMSPDAQPDGRASSEIATHYIANALAGGTPVFPWVHRDAAGNAVPCEVRLVRLPFAGRQLLRGSITDMTERTRAEQRQSMMMRELDHRVKNNLATMLALAEQTSATASTIDDFRDAFINRVRAMARTHEALAAAKWGGVPLGEVARLTLEPYGRGAASRIRRGGDAVVLTPTASSTLSMALHELATNAAKYGALSTPHGAVDLHWRCDGEDLCIDWIETGGPAVTRPTSPGFGTTLMRGVIEHELRGSVVLDYRPTGLCCRIRLPLASTSMEGLAAQGLSPNPA